jgi:hypothetical protein
MPVCLFTTGSVVACERCCAVATACERNGTSKTRAIAVLDGAAAESEAPGEAALTARIVVEKELPHSTDVYHGMSAHDSTRTQPLAGMTTDSWTPAALV